MNNKGFTLIELMATIILLTIIMSVGSYAVVGYMETSKEKSREILIENIKEAFTSYYNECDNMDIIKPPSGSDEEIINCSVFNNGGTKIKLNALLNYGFLSTTKTDNENNKIVVDPKSGENISNCEYEINEDSDPLSKFRYVVTLSTTEQPNCPILSQFYLGLKYDYK